MSNKAKAVGIFGGELYISSNGERVDTFDVIRPVSVEMLEQLHDIEYWKENERDLWIEAERSGRTDESLKEYFNRLMEDEDNGDEEFVGQDDSFCDIFDYDNGELRKKCDAFIKEHEGYEVGTWEASGFFSPDSFNKDFKKFDLVLDKNLAKKYYDYLKQKRVCHSRMQEGYAA